MFHELFEQNSYHLNFFQQEIKLSASQLAFTSSKFTIETLEQGMKYVIDVTLMFLLLTLNMFHTFF